MNAAEIDALERQVDNLIRKLNTAILGKRVQSFHLEHDDGAPDDYGDGDSSPSMEAEGNGNGNSDDDGDLEDDEEDESPVTKASVNRFLNQNDDDNRPGSLTSSSHPSSRHKFEALTDKIKNEQGIPKSEAMAQARQSFPDVYASYQRHIAGTSPSQQQSLRKSAPPTWDDLVGEQMAKGCNYEVAAQRVAQQFGYRALDHRAIRKSDMATVALEDAADHAWHSDDTLSRCEALRKSRIENPYLYKRSQRF